MAWSKIHKFKCLGLSLSADLDTSLPETRRRLSVVLPTFNECANVGPISEQLLELGDHYDLEILFVDDDSSDGTANAVRELAHHHQVIRLIRRVGRAGLSSAIKEGILEVKV